MKWNEINDLEKSINAIETCFIKEDFQDFNTNEIILEYKNKALILKLSQKLLINKTENEISNPLSSDSEYRLKNENLNEAIKQKDILIESLNEKIEEIKEEKLKFISEMSGKNNDEKLRETNIKHCNDNLELKNENIILTQKIEMLNNFIKEINERENQNIQVFKMQIFEQTQALKDQTSKYEEIIKNLKIQIDEGTGKKMESEYLLQNKDLMNEIQYKKLGDLNKIMILSMNDLTEKFIITEKLISEQKYILINL